MHVHHWSLYVSLSLSSITLLYHHHPEIHTRAENTSANRHTKKTPATIARAAPKFVLFHALSFKSTRHAINIKAEFMYQALGGSWHIYNWWQNAHVHAHTRTRAPSRTRPLTSVCQSPHNSSRARGAQKKKKKPKEMRICICCEAIIIHASIIFTRAPISARHTH